MALFNVEFNRGFILQETEYNNILTKAKENQIEECMESIKKIQESNTKDKVCFCIIEFFAQKGEFNHIEKLVSLLGSDKGSLLSKVRKQNEAYSRISIIFAEHCFIEQSVKCAYLIQSDWSRYDALNSLLI